MSLFGKSDNPKGRHMIEAVEVPTRSRLWSTQDADDAFELLSEGQAAKYGEYKRDPDNPKEDEGLKARTQGLALNKLIAERHNGRRFGVSVFEENGKWIGALLPREPKKYTGKKKKAKVTA